MPKAGLQRLLATLRNAVGRSVPWVLRWSRRVIYGTGVFALLLVLLAFTRVPFDTHRWLGMATGECTGAPELIVVLGGSGMPSGPELLRLDHAANLARAWPTSRVLVVHPGDPAVISAMADELVLKGVERQRITLVNEGDNTRAQALAILAGLGAKAPAMALVTAPENMYRSVLAFRKAGAGNVCGEPAWEHAMFHAFAYDHRRLGGKPWVPDVSGAAGVRYTFWNYLKLEITCLREFAAIAYYRLNGWI